MVDNISIARKKELDQPDPFLESLNKSVKMAGKYRKQLIWGLCTVLAVVLIVSGTLYSIKSSERNASELLADTMAKYSSDDPVKGYEAVKDSFALILEDYSNTTAGRMARMRFAEICSRATQFDKALELYRTALKENKGDAAMENIIGVALGHTCLILNRPEEAEQYFKDVVSSKSTLLKDEARFNLGLMLAARGDAAAGNEQFKSLIADYPDSMYTPVAKDRLVQ
ncbi:MAG: tetratricopeptide repeat protein [Pseudomonadota bacterium]